MVSIMPNTSLSTMSFQPSTATGPNWSRPTFTRQHFGRASLCILPGLSSASRLTAAFELAAYSKSSLAEAAVQREVDMSHASESLSTAAMPSAPQYVTASMQPASLTTMVLSRPAIMDPRVVMKPLTSLLSGPGSVIVGILMTVLAVVAWFRRMMFEKQRNCHTCRSYGVCRCSLCDGAGLISWEGKLQHSQICPSCFGNRFCKCPDCGGMAARSLFQHGNAGVSPLITEQVQATPQPLASQRRRD